MLQNAVKWKDLSVRYPIQKFFFIIGGEINLTKKFHPLFQKDCQAADVIDNTAHSEA